MRIAAVNVACPAMMPTHMQSELLLKGIQFSITGDDKTGLLGTKNVRGEGLPRGVRSITFLRGVGPTPGTY